MHKIILITALTALVAGCTTTTSGEAICDGSLGARKDLAGALASSPDDVAVVKGAALLQVLAAGCGE